MATVFECSSTMCNAQFIWCLTESGKRMPVDAVPAHDGTFELDLTGETPVAHFVPKHERSGRTDLQHSHFSTCGDVSWRGKR